MTALLILHSAVPPDAPPDEQDTLHQAAAVHDALERLGYSVQRLTLDALTPLHLRLNPPEVVINLVEARTGHSTLAYLGASLCETLHLPYTGNSTAALLLTGHKVWTKRLFRDAGLPTPDWYEQPPSALDAPYLLKSVTEDASLGLGPESVTADAATLAALWQAQQRHYGGAWFAERYLDGREFNLSLLETATGVQVLPIAEMCFVDYPAHKPKLIDYAAKWRPDSFSAQHTQRCFPAEEPELFAQLRALARRAWELLGLRGYARVDFRVDTTGQPWLLEVNANPCLDPEVGLAQAALQAGWDYPALLVHLAHLACPTLKSPASPAPAAPVPASSRWRTQVQPSDAAAIFALVETTGVFTAEECLLARELVETRLAQGAASGYEFVLAEQGGALVGYACFGPIPAAEGRYDLYWIAVAPGSQGTGLSQALLTQTFDHIRAQGGKVVYAETSSTPRYAPARTFYTRNGFKLSAVLPDFYRLNDSKLFYQFDFSD